MFHRQHKRFLNPLVVFVVLSLGPTLVIAQDQKTEPDVRQLFVEFVMKAYRSYERQDREALLSLCSQRSPYSEEFQRIVQAELALTANVKLTLQRILILKASTLDDRAEVRVLANMGGVDDKGHPAEGLNEEDHTLQLIKENGDWKIWRFTDTAEAFSEAYLKATTDAQRASLISKAQPITIGFTRGLLGAGLSLLEERGDDRSATVIFQLVALLADPQDVGGRASADIGMGDVYLAQGDYARAANNYQKVLTLAEKLDSKEGIAAVSVKMGNLHYQQGNLAQAMAHYLKSVQAYDELGSRIEITYPLVNLGSAYFSLGNYEKALEHYQKILKIYQQLLSKTGTAWLQNKIGDVYTAQAKYELALANYEQSLKAHEELGNKSMQAYSLYGIGRIRFTQGKYAEALTLVGRAAILAKAGNSSEFLWKILNLLGQTHRALHENDQARNAFAESIDLIEQLRNQVAGSERDQELSFENRTTPYIEMFELLLEKNDLAAAFVYAERAKGRMLLDVLRHGRADINRNMTDEERSKESSLNSAMTAISSQLRREIALPRPDPQKVGSLEERLNQARLDYDAYETRIHAAHPELQIQRGESRPITISEAESLVPDQQTVLLEYVVAPEKTYLFVLTRANTKEEKGAVEVRVFSIPITSRELASHVTQFRQTLAGNSLGFKEPSRELYDLLLRPAEKELEGKTVVCIVPSGQLWELPFQALLSPQERYVLQDHALFYAPSLSVLREMRKKNARHEVAKDAADVPDVSMVKVNATALAPVPALMAMGNPSLSAPMVSRARSDERSLSLGDLPEAEREVRDLGEIYGAQRSKILTGTAAREETVKAEAQRYTILHFATHGLLDDENPLYSRLLLASSNGNDDGFLEAREIIKLDLHADLVVLSACQTARGTIGPGEGLIGMSWAFFIAGASTTVVSQWKVDSASTSRLMVSFHRALQGADKPAPVSKAEALRRAALKLMSDPKYRHPFYWSGFVVVGSGI